MPTLSRCELVTFTRARRSHSQAPSAVARQPDRPTQVARAHSFVAEGEHHPPEPAALVSNVAERPYLVLRNLADISPLPPYTTSTSGLPTPTGTRGKTTTAIDSPITASDSYVIREIHAGIAAYSHSLRKDLPPSLYPAHGILPDPAARARHARIVMNYPVRFGDLDLDIIRRTFGNTFKLDYSGSTRELSLTMSGGEAALHKTFSLWASHCLRKMYVAADPHNPTCKPFIAPHLKMYGTECTWSLPRNGVAFAPGARKVTDNSYKTPDFAYHANEFTGAPQVVFEIGWTETWEDLRNDMKAWVERTNSKSKGRLPVGTQVVLLAKIDETKEVELVTLEKHRVQLIEEQDDEKLIPEAQIEAWKELAGLCDDEGTGNEDGVMEVSEAPMTNDEENGAVGNKMDMDFNDADDYSDNDSDYDPSANPLDELSLTSAESTTSIYQSIRETIKPDRWVGTITCTLEVWRYSRSTGQPRLVSTQVVHPQDPKHESRDVEETNSLRAIRIYERDLYPEKFPLDPAKINFKGRSFKMDMQMLREILWTQRKEYAFQRLLYWRKRYMEMKAGKCARADGEYQP